MKRNHHIIKYTLLALAFIITMFSCKKETTTGTKLLSTNQEVPVFINLSETIDKENIYGSMNSPSVQDSIVLIDNSIPGFTIKSISKKVNKDVGMKDKIAATTQFELNTPYRLFAYDKDGNYVKSKLMVYTNSSVDTMWLKPNATYTFVAYAERRSNLDAISYPNTLTANLNSARIRTNVNTKDGVSAAYIWKGDKLILPSSVTSHDNRLSIVFKPVGAYIFSINFTRGPALTANGRTIQIKLYSATNEGPYLAPMYPTVDINLHNQKIHQQTGTIIKKHIQFSGPTGWYTQDQKPGYRITGYYTNPDGTHYVNLIIKDLKLRNSSTLKEFTLNNPTAINSALKIPIIPGEQISANIELNPSETILAQMD